MPRLFLPFAASLSHLDLLNKRLRRVGVIAAVFALLTVLAFITSSSKPARRQLPESFFPFETTSAFSPVSHHDAANRTTQELCASFPHHLTQRIQPVLKMGHGENRNTIDAQLASVSACFLPDELLVFSDLDEELSAHGGHRAIDILANLPQAYRDRDRDAADSDGDEGNVNASPNPELANYEAMYALSREGRLTADNDPARGESGWRLDKYKFLAGFERAWAMRPGRDFYVFYETDTYVSWDNMFRFLSGLDPRAALYMGSPSPGRRDESRKVDTWFANGGPGFVLSRGAMEKLMSRRSSPDGGQYTDPSFLLKWLGMLRRDCCGDSVLGWALWHAGVPLSGFYPLFNTYAVHSLPYSERVWCQPFLTLHKSRPEDMVELWRWEHGRRTLGRPLLFSDLYEFLPVATPDVRPNWDNTVWDSMAPGQDTFVDSLQACREACEGNPACLQYMFQGEQTGRCVIQRFLNLGVPKEPETIERKVPVQEQGQSKPGSTEEQQPFRVVEEKLNYTSGWMKARIDEWVKKNPCNAPEWVYPSIERHY